MKAEFSALSKTISDLVPSAFYIPQNYCSKLYTASPHYIPSCHTAAKSAYLQTMSINSDTHRTSLRHRNTILCAHKLSIPWQRFGTFQLSLTIPEHSLGVITLLGPSPVKNLPASTVLEVQFASYA